MEINNTFFPTLLPVDSMISIFYASVKGIIIWRVMIPSQLISSLQVFKRRCFPFINSRKSKTFSFESVE